MRKKPVDAIDEARPFPEIARSRRDFLWNSLKTVGLTATAISAPKPTHAQEAPSPDAELMRLYQELEAVLDEAEPLALIREARQELTHKHITGSDWDKNPRTFKDKYIYWHEMNGVPAAMDAEDEVLKKAQPIVAAILELPAYTAVGLLAKGMAAAYRCGIALNGTHEYVLLNTQEKKLCEMLVEDIARVNAGFVKKRRPRKIPAWEADVNEAAAT